MTITWLGHSCFLLEEDGYRLVLDPFTQVAGLPDTRVEAHQVLCSHEHYDHNYTAGVTLLPQRPSPFTITVVDTFHDNQGGALRGPNRIHVLSAGGVTVAHLGDLGHLLTPEQLAAIGRLDAAMVPIGGTYTLDAAGARAVVEQLHPRVVIPMHYRRDGCGFEVLQTLEDFLPLPMEEKRYSTNTMTLTADTPAQVAVLALPAV